MLAQLEAGGRNRAGFGDRIIEHEVSVDTCGSACGDGDGE